MNKLVEKIDEIQNKEQKEAKNEKGGFFEGKIASIIVNEIIKLFPKDFNLRVEIFKIYKQFQNTEQLQTELVESLKNDFPDNPNAKYFISSLPLFSFSIVDDSTEFNDLYEECVSSFKNDLISAPGTPMFALFLGFYLDLLKRSNSQSTVLISPSLPLHSLLSFSSSSFLLFFLLLTKFPYYFIPLFHYFSLVSFLYSCITPPITSRFPFILLLALT